MNSFINKDTARRLERKSLSMTVASSRLMVHPRSRSTNTRRAGVKLAFMQALGLMQSPRSGKMPRSSSTSRSRQRVGLSMQTKAQSHSHNHTISYRHSPVPHIRVQQHQAQWLQVQFPSAVWSGQHRHVRPKPKGRHVGKAAFMEAMGLRPAGQQDKVNGMATVATRTKTSKAKPTVLTHWQKLRIVQRVCCRSNRAGGSSGCTVHAGSGRADQVRTRQPDPQQTVRHILQPRHQQDVQHVRHINPAQAARQTAVGRSSNCPEPVRVSSNNRTFYRESVASVVPCMRLVPRQQPRFHKTEIVVEARPSLSAREKSFLESNDVVNVPEEGIKVAEMNGGDAVDVKLLRVKFPFMERYLKEGSKSDRRQEVNGRRTEVIQTDLPLSAKLQLDS